MFNFYNLIEDKLKLAKDKYLIAKLYAYTTADFINIETCKKEVEFLEYLLNSLKTNKRN